jgi:hypothetical protein
VNNGHKITVKVGRKTITGLLQEWRADWNSDPFATITFRMVAGTKHVNRFTNSRPTVRKSK